VLVVSRATDLSALLTGPVDVTPARLPDRVLTRFVRELALVCEGQPRWRELVVTLPTLRRALTKGDRLSTSEEPFRWKPAFVRRSLGLAAIQSCCEGRYRSPAEAVGPVADDAVATWQRSGWRTYHWEPWLSYQPAGARAVVLAEATRWATSLWCAFDWSALGPTVRVGGPDEQWRCPPNGAVRLRGRVDLRVAGPRGEALVVTSAGAPPPTSECDLAFPALVAALSRPRRPVPGRVVGVWPDAGAHRTLDIGASALEDVAARVVQAVTAMVGDTDGLLAKGPAMYGSADGDDHQSDDGSGVVGTSKVRAAFVSGFPAAVSGMSSTRSS
jgi:hypothetical protein